MKKSCILNNLFINLYGISKGCTLFFDSMLYYRKVGKGFPVVFLHGFLESSKIWQFLNLEEMTFQSILIDLPGHGLSKEVETQPDLVHYSKQIFDTLEQINVKEFHLVGHSMGGYIAMEMAKENPNIQKIVLLNSNFWNDSESKRKERERVLKVLEHNKNRYIMEVIPNMFLYPERDKEFINNTINDALEIPNSSIKNATIAMMERPNLQDVAIKLGKNLKLVQGELDNAVPLALMLGKTKGKNFDLSIINNVGHMSYIEASEEVAKLLHDYIVG